MTEIIDFSNLTPRQSKFYDECAAKIIKKFNKIITEIYSLNNNNRNWFFSSVASRSPHRTNLFRSMCILYFINNYRSEGNEKLFYETNDNILFKLIKKSYDNIKLNKKRSECFEYFQILKNFIKYTVCVLTLCTITRIFGRVKFHNKSIVLIETFIYGIGENSGRINENTFHDRYFSGLMNVLKSQDIICYYVPSILYKDNLVKTLIKSLSIDDFIIKEMYLKIQDYISILILPFKKIKLPPKLFFLNFDINELVRRELRFNQFDSSKLVAEINFNFPKRLTENGVKVSFLLDWHENQVIDRGMSKGFREHCPQTLVVGCQGFIVCPVSNFYLYPTSVEKRNNLSPHIIAVNGTSMLSNPKEHIDIETIVIPSFRYSSIFKRRKYDPVENQLTILFPFEYDLNKSITNYKLLLDALEGIEFSYKVLIIIQLHPTHVLKDSNFLFAGNNIESVISNETFDLSVQKANIIVGAASSALVEALVHCPYVLIIANNAGLTANPIPNCFSRNYYVCYSSSELRVKIINLCKLNIGNLNKNIKSDLFIEPSRDEILKFISNLFSKHKKVKIL